MGAAARPATDTDAHREFETIALPHLDAVYGLARRLAGNEAEAEDLVQDTFLRAFRAFDRFELREFGAKPWLFKILHNVFFSRRSREARQPGSLDDADYDGLEDDSTASEPSEAGIDWEQVDDEIKAAIDAMAPEYRVVLVLWALEELSYKQIADVCGIAIGTVMSRLHRARRQLGHRLAEYARQHNIKRERGVE